MINRLLNNLHWFYRIDQDNEDDFVESLKSLLRSAHETIEKESSRSSEFRGMGTTFTLAYVAWPRLYVLHVGDTRCYLLRRGQMVQLTRDHTMASQLAEKGNLSRKELGQSPWANVLWNALGGGGRDVVADVTKQMLEPDDILMLCSDGLNKHVEDHEIQNILEIESEATAACRSLIDLANYRGGTDNITTIVAKFATPETGPAKTLVSAQVTLERMLGDLEGYSPLDTEPEATPRMPSPDVIDPSDRDTDPSLSHTAQQPKKMNNLARRARRKRGIHLGFQRRKTFLKRSELALPRGSKVDIDVDLRLTIVGESDVVKLRGADSDDRVLGIAVGFVGDSESIAIQLTI